MSFWDDFLKNPVAMNNVGTGLQVAGLFVGGLNSFDAGSQAREFAAYRAGQLRQNAGQVQAASQRTAYDITQQAQYAASAALATAAASGGGASDPTVVNLIARNAGEFAYRKAVALYEGEDKARALNAQADAAEYQGEAESAAAGKAGFGQFIGAATSLLKGSARGASLYQRFGGGGPSMVDIG